MRWWYIRCVRKPWGSAQDTVNRRPQNSFVRCSDYRLEVYSRFYFHLYVLEKNNTLPQILINRSELHRQDQTPHRSSGQFRCVGDTGNLTAIPSLPQAKTFMWMTVKCPQALLPGSTARLQQALLWPTWQEILMAKDRRSIILSRNVKFHKL